MLLGRELLGCVGVVAEARHAPANGHTMVSYGQLKAAMVGGQPESSRRARRVGGEHTFKKLGPLQKLRLPGPRTRESVNTA